MNYAPKIKTTPNFQSSRIKSGVSLPFKIVIGLVGVLAFLYIFFPHALPSLFLSLVNPLWEADITTRTGTATIEELRKTYLELSQNSVRDGVIIKENEDLKTELGRTKITKPLLATIVKRPPFSAYDSYIIDVGASEQVKAGNKVYALGSIPIGVVAEVIGDVSKVKLYSSAGEKFDVLVGPSHIEASAVGKGGGYFEVSMPRDTKIKKGDEVLVPSLGDAFVGTVDGIASEPSEPFAKILFHEPVNLYEQRWVLVDTSTHE